MRACVRACVCVCNILLYFFVFAVYLLVSYMCAKIEFGHVWLLTTLVYLLKLLYVNSCMVGSHMAQNLFILFCPLYVFIHFSAAFCTVHCALDIARDHAP